MLEKKYMQSNRVLAVNSSNQRNEKFIIFQKPQQVNPPSTPDEVCQIWQLENQKEKIKSKSPVSILKKSKFTMNSDETSKSQSVRRTYNQSVKHSCINFGKKQKFCQKQNSRQSDQSIASEICKKASSKYLRRIEDKKYQVNKIQ